MFFAGLSYEKGLFFAREGCSLMVLVMKNLLGTSFSLMTKFIKLFQFQRVIIIIILLHETKKEGLEGNEHFLGYFSHSISRRLDVSSPERDDNVVFIKESNCASRSTRSWYSSYSHIGAIEKKHQVGKFHRVGLHSMTV